MWNRTGLRAFAPALGLTAALGLSGCESLSGGERSVLQRDVYDINAKLDKLMESREAEARQFSYRLETIEGTLESRSSMTTSSIDALEQRIREQNAELEKMRQEMDELGYKIETSGRGSSSGGPGGAVRGDPLAGGTAASGQETPTQIGNPSGTMDGGAAATGGAADQVIANALRQFQLGNYTEARQGFEQALAMNPTGDNLVEANFWLAESYYQQSDYTRARGFYEDAIRANRSHQKAWVGVERLSDIEASRGNSTNAIVLLQQIIDKNPTYADIERVRTKLGQLQQ